MPEQAERVQAIANEVERYLTDHPQAADSVEGIASWWLARQRIHYELEMVRSALEHLRHKGVVLKTGERGKDGVVYRLNKRQ